jgi:16S rRNA (cytosine967-C5)-methyltransferase
MRLPGRAAAAIEVLTDIIERHRPAAEALKDWGKLHRFAGSSDRHAIGTLVYDALRRKNSAAHASASNSPRGLVLGTLRIVWIKSLAEIEALCVEQHGPGALTMSERDALSQDVVPQIDMPDWLLPSLKRTFGSSVASEVQALSQRAPIDLRVNALKASREQVIAALKSHGAQEGAWSPWAVRIDAPGPDQKHINVEAEIAHGKGWFEVQDAASQVAAMLSGAKPGERIADICAGAGGKTLALAAMMNNTGTLFAHDNDKRRLRPIFERLTRAGVTCVNVQDDVAQLTPASFDCVVIDAPCSGSGSWRRKPDAKWRLKPAQLEIRRKEQREVLATGAKLVKPGGRMIYITCSILPEENVDQVDAFLKQNKTFKLAPYQQSWPSAAGSPPVSALGAESEMLLLTSARHSTDGFFIAIMQKS